MDFFVDHAVGFALACAAVAVLYGMYLIWWLLKQPAGNERMQEIARAVQEGAAAYLRKQYTTIAVVAIVPFFLLGFYDKLGWGAAFGFLIGALFSAAAGFIGMNVAVRSNVRTAEAAREGLQPAFKVAFRAGSVTGLLVVGLGLLGVAGYYWVLTGWIGNSPESAVDDLIGLAFGGSLISVFARLGGGIYTKAADVGADLVGKIEAGIPEDDPRNPAVIADNVGDNVGDCAGMAADLFETYAVTAVAVMLLGISIGQSDLWLYPLALGGISILSSVIGTFFTRVGSGQNAIINALYRSIIVATVLSALGFIPVTQAFDGGEFDFWNLYGSALIGLGVTFLLVAITEYYTGTRWKPVKDIAKASQTGHATNIIYGLAVGMQATALPVVVIATGIIGAYYAAGQNIYGIGVAVMAQLSMAGLIVALDAYGPVTDNAGGIAEMADLPEGVRGITDPLDAVGNTTKAVTKGYAIGSAGLAALILFDSTTRGSSTTVSRSGSRSTTLGSSPACSSAASCRSCSPRSRCRRSAGSAGRSSRRCGASSARTRDHGPYLAPRLLEGDRDRHGLRDQGDDGAGAHPDPLPDRRRDHQIEMLGGLLIGTIVTGLFLAIAMTSGGGAWDNAKKTIEDGLYGGKGSDAHAAAVTGDTVGDPYKDTAGPAINPMIKIANIVAILIIPLLVSIHGLAALTSTLFFFLSTITLHSFTLYIILTPLNLTLTTLPTTKTTKKIKI